jgi:hypothetical protein
MKKLTKGEWVIASQLWLAFIFSKIFFTF